VNITRQPLCLKAHFFSDGLASPHHKLTSIPLIPYTSIFTEKCVSVQNDISPSILVTDVNQRLIWC